MAFVGHPILDEIRHGRRLKPTRTVDKSAPVILAEGENVRAVAKNAQNGDYDSSSRGSCPPVSRSPAQLAPPPPPPVLRASSSSPALCKLKEQKVDEADRGKLLEGIRGGVRLRRVVTNDKSAPVLDVSACTPSPSASRNDLQNGYANERNDLQTPQLDVRSIPLLQELRNSPQYLSASEASDSEKPSIYHSSPSARDTPSWRSPSPNIPPPPPIQAPPAVPSYSPPQSYIPQRQYGEEIDTESARKERERVEREEEKKKSDYAFEESDLYVTEEDLKKEIPSGKAAHVRTMFEQNPSSNVENNNNYNSVDYSNASGRKLSLNSYLQTENDYRPRATPADAAFDENALKVTEDVLRREIPGGSAQAKIAKFANGEAHNVNSTLPRIRFKPGQIRSPFHDSRNNESGHNSVDSSPSGTLQREKTQSKWAPVQTTGLMKPTTANLIGRDRAESMGPVGDGPTNSYENVDRNRNPIPHLVSPRSASGTRISGNISPSFMQPRQQPEAVDHTRRFPPWQPQQRTQQPQQQQNNQYQQAPVVPNQYSPPSQQHETIQYTPSPKEQTPRGRVPEQIVYTVENGLARRAADETKREETARAQTEKARPEWRRQMSNSPVPVGDMHRSRFENNYAQPMESNRLAPQFRGVQTRQEYGSQPTLASPNSGYGNGPSRSPTYTPLRFDTATRPFERNNRLGSSMRSSSEVGRPIMVRTDFLSSNPNESLEPSPASPLRPLEIRDSQTSPLAPPVRTSIPYTYKMSGNGTSGGMTYGETQTHKDSGMRSEVKHTGPPSPLSSMSTNSIPSPSSISPGSTSPGEDTRRPTQTQQQRVNPNFDKAKGVFTSSTQTSTTTTIPSSPMSPGIPCPRPFFLQNTIRRSESPRCADQDADAFKSALFAAARAKSTQPSYENRAPSRVIPVPISAPWHSANSLNQGSPASGLARRVIIGADSFTGMNPEAMRGNYQFNIDLNSESPLSISRRS